MKKMIKLFISIFLVFGLFACSSNEKNKYVGRYDIISMNDGSTQYNKELLDSANIHYYVELNEDGTVIMDLGSGEESGKWSEEKLSFKDGYIKCSIEEDTLTLTEDEYSMVFKKDNE